MNGKRLQCKPLPLRKSGHKPTVIFTFKVMNYLRILHIRYYIMVHRTSSKIHIDIHESPSKQASSPQIWTPLRQNLHNFLHLRVLLIRSSRRPNALCKNTTSIRQTHCLGQKVSQKQMNHLRVGAGFVYNRCPFRHRF